MLWQRPGLLAARPAAKLGGEVGGDFGWGFWVESGFVFCVIFFKKKFFHGSLEMSSFRILYLASKLSGRNFGTEL